MLIGYVRVSKADGSQSLDLQRDALLAKGVSCQLNLPVGGGVCRPHSTKAEKTP